MKEQNRLVKKYKEEVVPALMKEYKYGNINEVPKLVKVVLLHALQDCIVFLVARGIISKDVL